MSAHTDVDVDQKRHDNSNPRSSPSAARIGPLTIPISKTNCNSNNRKSTPREIPGAPGCRHAYHSRVPTSIHTLLRERQLKGAGRFLAREGAGLWSPDPLSQAVGRDHGILRRLQLSGELRGHRGCVNTVSCTPDGKFWITGSDDMKLMIWDCESHKRKKVFTSGHRNNVFQARALPYTGNEKIVSCAADGQVRLAHLSTGQSTCVGSHNGRAHRLAIEPGSPNRFLTCGEDGVVLSFDVRASSTSGTGNQGGTVILQQDDGVGISSMALNPADPNYLFVCGSSAYVDLYDARKSDAPAARYCPMPLRYTSAHVTGCAVNWCGSEMIATYNPTGEVFRFDVKKHAAETDNSPRRDGGRSVRQRRNTPDVLAAPMAGGALGGGSSGGGGGNNNDGVSSSTTTTTTTDSAAVRRARRAGHDDGEDQEDEDREDREDEENGRRDETGPGGKRSSDWSEEASGEEDEERASSYAMKYTGHRNLLTVKQVTFYGPRSEFVASGSDCGHIFLWDKNTAKLEMLLFGDSVGAVNCLEPHPFLPVLATSGLSHTAKVWRPTRNEPLPADRLVGKGGKPAAEVVAANAMRARDGARSGRAPVNITPAMLRTFLGMGPSDSDDDDDDGDGDGDGDNDEEARGAAGYARGRSLRRLLATISRVRMARLRHAPGASFSDDEHGGNDQGQDEDDDEDEDEDSSGRGRRRGFWAGGRFIPGEGDENEDDDED